MHPIVLACRIAESAPTRIHWSVAWEEVLSKAGKGGEGH